MTKKRTKAPSTGKPDARLATEQYSELNATLYSSAPYDYLRARMQSIIFTLTDASEAEQILKKETRIGALLGGPSARLPQEARIQYAALETTVLLHHAGESLLRLWLAHKDAPPCPWLKVAEFRDFRKLKEEAQKHYEQPASHFDRAVIASVFLGGPTAEEAGVDLAPGAWLAAVDGIIELLKVVGHRLTAESDMYNAAKHGLVGIPADHGNVTINDVRVGGGLGITYLQNVQEDRHDPSSRKWWATTTFIGLESNLLLIELIIRAIHSIWAVGRRAHIGMPGSLVPVSRDEVFAALSVSPIAEKRHLAGMSQTLPTYNYSESGERGISNLQGRAEGIGLGPDVLEAYDRLNGVVSQVDFIDLPLRPGDRKVPSDSSRHFFHFSPAGSSSL